MEYLIHLCVLFARGSFGVSIELVTNFSHKKNYIQLVICIDVFGCKIG